MFVVVDTSTGQTKKITREELNNAIEQDVLSTVDINGGTIDGTTIGATTAAAGSFTTVDATGNITVGGTVDGRDVAADGTKLDGIEASATADQTGAQIATALNGETISSLTALTTTGAVIVGGDFTVNGTTTTINSTTLEVDDKNIVLASGAADAAAANGSGITIDGASATFTYASTGDKWQLNKPLDVTGTVAADGLTVQGDAYFDTNNAGRALHITRYGTVESESANFTIDDNDLVVESIQDEQYGGYVFKATHNGVGTRNRLDIANNGDISFYEDTGTTAKLFWDASAENLGLGASTFNATYNPKLQVTSDQSDGTGGVLIQNYLPTLTLEDISGGAAASQIQQDQTNMLFKNGGSERLRIDSSGSVLISTTSSDPRNFTGGAGGVKLGSDQPEFAVGTMFINRSSTSDGDAIILRKEGSTFGSIGVKDTDLYIGKFAVGLSFDSTGADGIRPFDIDTQTYRDNAIDLGGESARFNDLYLGGVATIGADSGDGFNSDATLRLQKASGGSNYVQIKTATTGQGGILIGDTDDDFVGGMIYNNSSNYLRFDSNNAEKMRLEGDGDLHVDGNVVAYSTTVSDIRLKKDIAPIEDAVTKVQQLNGCTFTYLKDGRQSAGLLAQDLEKVLPSAVIEDEAVFHGEEGETYKTVQYDQVIGLLVEAVKELKAEIEELKNGTAK